MSLRLLSVRFFRYPMETRFPFQYGITKLTKLWHLIVVAEVEYNGQRSTGMSADGLAPKWFTKDPDTSVEDDINEMLAVISRSANTAIEISSSGQFFDWWWDFYQEQTRRELDYLTPSLLTGFGISLIERAVLDAFCRLLNQPFHQTLLNNDLGIDPGRIRPELSELTLNEILPAKPSPSVRIRHTIGLSDPLTDDDIPATSRLNDGLPHSLANNIRTYGLTHFKIKLGGNIDIDSERLTRIAGIVTSEAGNEAQFTLDGNENYRTVGDFRTAWDTFAQDNTLQSFMTNHLLLVEQPIHRDSALTEDVAQEFADWTDAPSVIIDESDADLSSLPTALQCGYQGTSHKNCKGIMKGLINAATIHQANQIREDKLILSAEDLANVGPIALPQDLAVVASLGLDHVERNGHHYFAGLSSLSEAEQQRTLDSFPDLYESHQNSFPTLKITNGQINLLSITTAPFGLHQHPEIWGLTEFPF